MAFYTSHQAAQTSSATTTRNGVDNATLSQCINTCRGEGWRGHAQDKATRRAEVASQSSRQCLLCCFTCNKGGEGTLASASCVEYRKRVLLGQYNVTLVASYVESTTKYAVVAVLRRHERTSRNWRNKRPSCRWPSAECRCHPALLRLFGFASPRSTRTS